MIVCVHVLYFFCLLVASLRLGGEFTDFLL